MQLAGPGSPFINVVTILVSPGAIRLALLPTIAKEMWAKRQERAKQDARALTIKLQEQKHLNSEAIKAKLKGELLAEDFDALKENIKQEIARIEDAITALESERSTMEELIAQRPSATPSRLVCRISAPLSILMAAVTGSAPAVAENSPICKFWGSLRLPSDQNQTRRRPAFARAAWRVFIRGSALGRAPDTNVLRGKPCPCHPRSVAPLLLGAVEIL
jgi:hypothetical protein